MYNICVLSIYKNIVLRVTKLRESKILQNSSTIALHGGGVVLVWQYTVLTYSFPNLESACCSMSSSNLLLLDLHTDFPGGRTGGLVFPSLSEFSTVCCDSHSQRLWHSQWSRSRCSSGTLLLFRWSNRYWQFNLCFLCLL